MGTGEFYARIASLYEEGTGFVLATIVRATGGTPRKIGSKMLILPDGSTVDTLGGGKLEHQVIQDALECLQRGVSRVVKYELRPSGDHALGTLCGGEAEVLLDVHLPLKTLLIIGAGHIAQKLCPMAKLLDFRVLVLDDRKEFATPERFPEADEVICEHPAKTAEVVPITESFHIVIVTHAHVHDKDALRAVISSPAAYIGMIGSRQKVRTIMTQLAEEGVDPARLARVCAPIGLELGGQTPAELSLSILAEIVANMYGKLPLLRPSGATAPAEVPVV